MVDEKQKVLLDYLYENLYNLGITNAESEEDFEEVRMIKSKILYLLADAKESKPLREGFDELHKMHKMTIPYTRAIHGIIHRTITTKEGLDAELKCLQCLVK